MEFIDLSANYTRIKDKIDAAIMDVLSSGKYILGPAVQQFEKALADYVGVKHAIGCANGTDALLMPLMAKNIKAGDAVFCPSFTFAATAEVIALAGATPVFIDIDASTYNLNIDSLKRAISMVKEEAVLQPKAIIAVDLFGLAANYNKIKEIAIENNLLLIEDAAQSIGGKTQDGMCGALGHIASTSFYPAKPLGCYGDGGAMFTNDDEEAEILRSILFHGKGATQYDNLRIGLNSRLDTIQAAILLQKLQILEDEMERRSNIGAYYTQNLSDICITPYVPHDMRSAYAQYTIMVEDRNELQRHLQEHHIPTMVYYPKGLHLQKAYQDFPRAKGGLPETEKVSQKVLSLPIHPYLKREDQDLVINTIKKFYKK